MLYAHMDYVESSLAETAKVPGNAGHKLHRGLPREAFIRKFLEGHLSENVAIGTGEIIDHTSAPSLSRNQFDIVLYKKNYPKLNFGGCINGFLIESVIATIEVKSLIDNHAIFQSVCAARNAKQLTPSLTTSFATGWIPPKILNFVVGYRGPRNMSTVHNWIKQSHATAKIALPTWTPQTRITTPGTALDGVFILQRGFVKLDNTPTRLDVNSLSTDPTGTHIVCNSASGNLLMLFLSIQEACNNIHGAWLNPAPYLQAVRYPSAQIR